MSRVGRIVEARGAEFNMILDHSDVIFKMDNPDEQRIFNTDKKVAPGELVVDPFQPGDVIAEWVSAGWIRHCHACAVVHNNPKNIPAHHPDGSVGRGIQYPFIEPGEDGYHDPWSAEALETWKEGMRILLRHRAQDTSAKLGQISTKFIPNTDYGEGC